jgi:hypothetical protein
MRALSNKYWMEEATGCNHTRKGLEGAVEVLGCNSHGDRRKIN